MTQGSTIINIKKFFAQNGVFNRGYFVFFDYLKKRFDMVNFQSFFRLTKNTSEIISFKNILFPFYIPMSSSNFFVKLGNSAPPIRAFFIIFSKFYLPVRITFLSAKYSFSLFYFKKVYKELPLTHKAFFSDRGFFVVKFNSIFRNTRKGAKLSILLFSSISKILMAKFALFLGPFFRRVMDAIAHQRTKFVLFFGCQFRSKLFFANKTIIKNWITIPRSGILFKITGFTTIFSEIFRGNYPKNLLTMQTGFSRFLTISHKVTFLRTIFPAIFSNCGRIYKKYFLAIKTMTFYHGIGIIPSYSYLVKEKHYV